MGKVTIDEETLDGIGQAIIAKGGATAPMTPAQMPAAIQSIPSGGGGSSGVNDVNFYMPDGTIAKSYTAAEFAGLTALPDQPSLDGLTAQGWNWALADAKTYVASYGKLNIGGMYATDNGETRLYLTIAEPYRLEQPLRFGRSGGTGITVDWGDGSTPVTYTHTEQTIVKHTYPGSGDYVIRLSSVGGAEILLEGSSTDNIFGSSSQSSSNPARAYSSRLKKVEIGSSVTIIGDSAFSNCYSLSSVVIPYSVTSIEISAFSNCYSLSSVTIPSSVTSIGNSAFTNCYSLSSVVIPSSVTSIGNSAFTNCSGIVKYDFTEHAQVPTIPDVGAFRNIAPDCKIVVPDALYDTWITATNWSDASIVGHIIKASEYVEA